MGTCMARRGFLTLSDCGNPAASLCTTCSRPMCAAHLAPQSGFTQCFDCAATNATVREGEHDDLWAHRYRSTYYTASGYRPIYSGSHHDTYYDDQDVRSFDDEPNEEMIDEEETDRGGFGES